MKKIILLAAIVPLLDACVPHDMSVEATVRNNPKIVFQVIEDNPTEFVDTVNRAVQNAQRKQGEKQAAEMKDRQEKDVKNPKQAQLETKRRLSGTSTGKIVVVEYGDFQCPACGMAYEGLKKFKERHKDEVQFYFKNMPLDFHKMAYPASEYFEAISLQDKAKAQRFFDYLFENQRELMSDGFLAKAAKLTGANMAKVESDLKSAAVKKAIADDMQEFNKFAFTGTPVVILNGVALEGAQRVEDLERVLELTRK